MPSKKSILIALTSLAALILALYAALELGLKNTIKEQIIASIENSASNPDAKLEIGDIGFSLTHLLRLNPVIEVKDINYSGIFAAKQVELALELLPLLRKQLYITKIKIYEATLVLKPPRQKEITIPKLNAIIDGVKSNEVAKTKVWANIYGSKRSVFEYEGTIGPIPDLDKLATMQSLPLTGKARLNLNFVDLPLALRQKLFGAALMSPAASDRVVVDAQLSGDILHDIKGSGKAKLNQVRMGKSPARYMIASAQAPFSFTINAIEKQKAYFSVNSARLVLAASRGSKRSGEINAQANFTSDLPTGYMTGTITGNLRGIDINEMISSFTPTEDALFGIFTVPSFRLNLAGVTNEEQMQSLTGSGSMTIDDVNAPLIDKLLAFKDFVRNPNIANGMPAVKEHVIGKLNSSFNIAEGHFNTPDLAIATPVAQLHGGGFFNYKPVLKGKQTEPQLEYQMNLEVGTLPPVPLIVRGTGSKPKIKADVKNFAAETGKQLVKQIIYQKFMSQAGANGQVVNPPAEIVPQQLLNKLLKKI